MSDMRVVLANEPAMYREVISTVLKDLRPRVEVFTAKPEDLNREFSRLLPQLVVCSRLTELVERNAAAWIELYPDGSSHTLVALGDKRATFADMDFDTLLAILDIADGMREHNRKTSLLSQLASIVRERGNELSEDSSR
jgi:hypothetical protein